MPFHGEIWTSVEEQVGEGMHIDVVELEPEASAVTSDPAAGVGQGWERGSGGEGSLLAGDTMQPRPDRARVGFMRSCPTTSRCRPAWCGGSPTRPPGCASGASTGTSRGRSSRMVPPRSRSAERHIAWGAGEHDDLT